MDEPGQRRLEGRSDEGSATPFGAYWLERRIAVGGMSEVFLARPRSECAAVRPGTERVVLKRLLPDLLEDDAVREAFETEARLHALVRDPNVVEFYEFGTYAGEPFIAMEYVEGVDLARIMRRAHLDDRQLPLSLAIHVARHLCASLRPIHELVDEVGLPLGVVHRDVTPSNVLVSTRGEIKLGDFGIAHSSRAVVARTSLALKGKYAYLAPEQVSGDHFDHRADLFSLAVVLAEMLLGDQVFPGNGQLAVLLAIRDARPDNINKLRGQIPDELFSVVTRALRRDPDERYATAVDLAEALAPFATSERGCKAELSGWVHYSLDTISAARQLQGAVAETLAHSNASGVKPIPGLRRTASPLPETLREQRHDQTRADAADRAPSSKEPISAQSIPSEPKLTLLRSGAREPITLHLAKLIELLATGQVRGTDMVDLGEGFHRVEELPVLARYMQPSTATTKQLSGPGIPDFTASLPMQSVAEALGWIARREETGVLFADPEPDPAKRVAGEADRSRTELYFHGGKLILAVSNEKSTLLGEQLIAQGLIERAELELAVLVMHRYNGQLGDTLVGLGLCDPVDVFRAIRAQGRQRLTALFRWQQGRLSFYRAVVPARVDFRLDLDVPGLILAGLAESISDSEILTQHGLLGARSSHASAALRTISPPPEWAKRVTWPAVLMYILRAFTHAATPLAVIEAHERAMSEEEVPASRPIVAKASGRAHKAFSRAEILRAIEVGKLLGLLVTA
ncbi:MAG: serine/threonine-protein kinase [Polyangiaceae bacterium]